MKFNKLHKHIRYLVYSEELKAKTHNPEQSAYKRGCVFICNICKKRTQKIYYINKALNNRLNAKKDGKHEVILQADFIELTRSTEKNDKHKSIKSPNITDAKEI